MAAFYVAMVTTWHSPVVQLLCDWMCQWIDHRRSSHTSCCQMWKH